MARLWVPIENDFDQGRLGYLPADRPERMRTVADAYGLDAGGRAELVGALDVAMDRVALAARRSYEAGDANFVALWERTDGAERYERRRRWWELHRSRFVSALR